MSLDGGIPALMIREPGRRYRQATKEEVLARASDLLRVQLLGAFLTKPRDAQDWLAARLRPLGHEVFVMITLTGRHQVIATHELFRGSVASATVYPREVVKTALLDNAAAVIIAHNHPSGIAEPSAADELQTVRLREALALIEVRIIDHLIVGADHIVSFAERGLI